MMKKTIRVLSVLLCLCCLIGALCACSSAGNAKLKNLYAKSAFEDKTPAMTTGAKLDFEGTLVVADGDLAIVSDEKKPVTYRVYNISTNSVVLTFTETDSEKLTGDNKAGILTVGDETLFWLTKGTTVNKNTSYTTLIYDANGKLITDLPKQTVPVAVADMMMVENRYYRLEEGGVFTLKFEHSMLAGELPTFTAWNKDYYYAVEDDGVKIYSSRGMLAGSYAFPSDATNTVACIMNDGNVIIQSVFRCPDDSNKYDYYDAGRNCKYNVESLLYRTANGTTSELDLDYILVSSFARNTGAELMNNALGFDDIAKGIDNIATIMEINDRRVDTDHIKLVSVNNRGDVKKVLNDVVSLPSTLIAVPATAGRYVVITTSMEIFMLDESGKQIGEITNMENANDDFILTGGRVYDMDLKYVYDYGSNNYELEQVLDHVLILSKTDSKSQKSTYYILKKGMTAPQALDGTFSDANEYYYAVQNQDKKYAYYNENGDIIFTADEKLTFVSADISDDAVLLKGKTAFYRFSK